MSAEEQRDEYAKMLREFLKLSNDFAETRHGYLRFLVMADRFEDEHPELMEEKP